MKLKSRVLASTAMVAAIYGSTASADTIPVRNFRYAGPYILSAPLQLDSVDTKKAKFDPSGLLKAPVALSLTDREGREWSDSVIPPTDRPALHLIDFTLDNSRFLKGTLKIEGVKNYQLYIDGRLADNGELALKPSTRKITIKCLTDSTSSDTLLVSLVTPDGKPAAVTVASGKGREKGRRYSSRDIFTGRFMRSTDVSPKGKYLYTGYYYVNDDGTSDFYYNVTDLATGRLVMSSPTQMEWMPQSERLCHVRRRDGRQQLVAVNPADGREEILADDLPETSFVISPSEDFLILFKTEEGRKEKNEGLYRIMNPEDRQKGWRDRGQLLRYDLRTGITTPLTFGNTSAMLCGISDDGGKLLFMTSDMRFTERPTTLMSLYLLDLKTMEAEKIVDRDGFISSATLSPDGRSIAIIGSPEALGGIGNVLPEGKTPSMVDNQLYILDIASRKATPLTRNFNPSVGTVIWNRADGMIYFSAEDRDLKKLFRASPTSGKIEVLGLPEDYILSFALAGNAPIGAYYGESADSSYRLYTFDTKTLKATLRDDLHPERTEGLEITPTYDWSYTTSRGDTIQARYNLPADFDPSKKYPMIVYYYGGCSPTGRLLDTVYNPHLFSANGYIFLVINPSGATGFGQEFASRHVATAGEGVAQDIIEGVKRFSEENAFVNADKIGCMGASYGGFMTQYLQTVTDIFAAAISHAGISDHTSYWGEGYWGYSYSEVSMADKYPWTDRDLYVGHSPLYNADKIHTPLLFLHGDADTNVPFGESIQMFTALKLLGRETELVAVKDTNHWVQDFTKREHWLNTMLAWFSKYLQDDPTWWNEMYED